MLVVSPNILEEVFRYLASYFIPARVRDLCKIKIIIFYFGQKIIKIGHKVNYSKVKKIDKISHP